MRIVPSREVDVARTLNVRVPLPVPGLPDRRVMNGSCGVAVHVHPAGMVTTTENCPPLKVTGTVAGDAVGGQFGRPAWMMDRSCPDG
jgi:hypothetical protein